MDRITATHLAEVEQKISDLKRLAKELRRLNSCCKGNRTIADCRIIEALSPDLARAGLTKGDSSYDPTTRKPVTQHPAP